MYMLGIKHCTGGPRDTRLMGPENGYKIPRISKYRKSNLVISSQNITNFRIILQVGGSFSYFINYLIWYWLNTADSNLLKWVFTFDLKRNYVAFENVCVKLVQFAYITVKF